MQPLSRSVLEQPPHPTGKPHAHGQSLSTLPERPALHPHCLTWTCRARGIRHRVAFWGCLPSRRAVFLRSPSFLFKPVTAHGWLGPMSLSCPSTDRYSSSLGLSPRCREAVCARACFSWADTWDVAAGSGGISMLSVLRTFRIVLQSGCNILHSHQQRLRVPIPPRPHELLLSVSFFS